MNLAKWQVTRAIYINQLCFYTPATNTVENENKITIPFALASENIKYLGINLMKGLQTLLRKIKKHLNKWRHTVFRG